MVKNLPFPSNTIITVKTKTKQMTSCVKKKTRKDSQEAEKHLPSTIECNATSIQVQTKIQFFK